ncbi:MAG: DUF3467 domain-containing protein [Gammaproteobacteria bacterium]
MESKDDNAAPLTNVNAATLEHIKSPQFRTIYSNNVRSVSSPFEVRITFSHISDAIGPAGQNFVNEEEVSVIMPPITAKSLLEVLQGTLSNHEKLWGEITLPPGITSTVSAMSDEKK